MAGLLERLWRLITPDRSWREVRRSVSHPELGEVRFVGRRTREDARAEGLWYVQPAAYSHEISIVLPDQPAEETPPAASLAQVAELLRDPDALFARSSTQMAAAHLRTVEKPMPLQWRDTFHLASIGLPSIDDPDREWNVDWWCEPALHWFVVRFRGDEVVDVDMEG